MGQSNIWIIITSINHPTKAVIQFGKWASVRDWKVLLVGDTKTPSDWNCEGVKFLSVEKQKELFPVIAEQIPLKHYCRKNIGYLYAIQNGADIIIDTDDDNLPYDNFAVNLNKKITAPVLGSSKWINIYAYYADSLIWPRGLPLNYIHEKGEVLESKTLDCPVQQFLADEDPDVDAIFRLLFKQPTYFNKNTGSFIIDAGTYVPFNSQNTVFYKESFILMYLPCFVSFRMTDIWRSFVVKRILNHFGKHMVFHDATVWQERNTHNLMKDFTDEIIGYTDNEKIINTIDSVDLTGLEIKDSILKIWKSLEVTGIVKREEIEIIENWLSFF